MADYTRYLQALIDHRRSQPREDLISDLVHGANGYPGVPDEYVHNMIRGAARVADRAHLRGDVDDAAAAARDEHLADGLADQVGAAHVDVHDEIEVGHRLLERRGRPVEAHLLGYQVNLFLGGERTKHLAGNLSRGPFEGSEDEHRDDQHRHNQGHDAPHEKSEHTLEEVGKQFAVTRERIRQIESKALEKLRRPARARMHTSLSES